MKKLLIAMLAAAAFFSTSALAQGPKGKIGLSKQTLMDSLKISDVTADSVIAIRTQSISQIRTIMSDDKLTQDEKKEKAKPIAQETKVKLKKFLTEEQIEKMHHMEMDRRKNMMNKES
jgi:hypothetical protein